MSLPSPHLPVMPAEVIEALEPKGGQLCVDATLGAGGHAALLIPRLAPGGTLLGLDADPTALELARERLAPLASEHGVALELVHANFRDLASVLNGRLAAGILADLGVSSMQFDRPERGFSFRADAPLDMRMDPTQGQTAAEFLHTHSEEEIADTLFHLGGERGSRRIARRIVEARARGEPIATTGQLEQLVRSALKVRGHKRIHPATRTFQALRMAVNRELDSLATFLEAAPEGLAPGGTLCVISFHSGEDRLVKQGLKSHAASGRFQLIRKGIVRPSQAECRANPRSRSAKLRAVRRLA